MSVTRMPLTLVRARYPEGLDEMFAYYGYEAPDVLVDAVPWQGFDETAWTIKGCEPTAFVSDGEVLDLGDRLFSVLHVPGHTAGSIALWEQATGVLFTGDTVYADDRLSFDDPGAGAPLPTASARVAGDDDARWPRSQRRVG